MLVIAIAAVVFVVCVIAFMVMPNYFTTKASRRKPYWFTLALMTFAFGLAMYKGFKYTNLTLHTQSAYLVVAVGLMVVAGVPLLVSILVMVGKELRTSIDESNNVKPEKGRLRSGSFRRTRHDRHNKSSQSLDEAGSEKELANTGEPLG